MIVGLVRERETSPCNKNLDFLSIVWKFSKKEKGMELREVRNSKWLNL